jgi:hypothetical protein
MMGSTAVVSVAVGSTTIPAVTVSVAATAASVSGKGVLVETSVGAAVGAAVGRTAVASTTSFDSSTSGTVSPPPQAVAISNKPISPKIHLICIIRMISSLIFLRFTRHQTTFRSICPSIVGKYSEIVKKRLRLYEKREGMV